MPQDAGYAFCRCAPLSLLLHFAAQYKFLVIIIIIIIIKEVPMRKCFYLPRLVVNHDIVRLHVTMYDAHTVAVVKRLNTRQTTDNTSSAFNGIKMTH